MEIGQVIAERVMVFVGDTGVREDASLRVGLPVKIEDEAWCFPYELRTESRSKAFGIYGVDALQTLELTMKTLPVEVDHWQRHQKGTFLFIDDKGAAI